MPGAFGFPTEACETSSKVALRGPVSRICARNIRKAWSFAPIGGCERPRIVCTIVCRVAVRQLDAVPDGTGIPV